MHFVLAALKLLFKYAVRTRTQLPDCVRHAACAGRTRPALTHAGSPSSCGGAAHGLAVAQQPPEGDEITKTVPHPEPDPCVDHSRLHLHVDACGNHLWELIGLGSAEPVAATLQVGA